MASSAAKLLGLIADDVSYPLPLLMQYTGQGRKSIAKAKRDGLPVCKVGRRAYVLGKDWNNYLAKQTATA